MRKTKVSPAGQLVMAPLQDELNPPQRILVAEDDADIRRLNAEALMNSGYQVDTAEDGAEAWDAVQLNNYDLLVTDHNMPNVSGVELLKKIHSARIALPAILVTGDPPTQELHQHPWLQIEAMLLKPYTLEEFLTTVSNVLHATTSNPAPIVLPSERQSPPPTNRLRLR